MPKWSTTGVTNASQTSCSTKTLTVLNQVAHKYQTVSTAIRTTSVQAVPISTSNETTSAYQGVSIASRTILTVSNAPSTTSQRSVPNAKKATSYRLSREHAFNALITVSNAKGIRFVRSVKRTITCIMGFVTVSVIRIQSLIRACVRLVKGLIGIVISVRIISVRSVIQDMC